MTKRKITLTGRIGRIGCLVAAAALAVFFLIAGDRTERPSEDVSIRASAPWIIRPGDFGSYGELMFAYIGEGNRLYNLDDESAALTQDKAGELLYASDDSVLYLSPCETSFSHPGREFIIRELQVGERENMLNTIATVSVHPCWSGNDEVIYFVQDSAPETLCTFEPLTSTTEEAVGFDQPVTGLRISSDGLLVTLENGMELLYVPLSKSLTEPLVNCRGMQIEVCEQYDLVLSAEGTLYYHWQGSPELTPVSEQVIAAISHQDNELYYLKKTESAVTLCAFIVSEETETVLCEMPADLLPQLTADANTALMLDASGAVYAYDIAGGTVRAVLALDLAAVRAPLISLFDYRLMVYDLSREPDQTFCQAIPLDHLETLNAVAPVFDPIRLSMGDSGEAVTALQQRLAAGGWLDGCAPGFYDTPTLWAVRYAQSALGLADTGVVTEEFMSALGGDIPEAPDALSGMEILDAQARLRTLGYLSGPLSGVWDEETARLCAQLRGDDPAVSLWEALAQAAPAAEPQPLTLGDSSHQALALNHRLYDLQYMAALPDATVTQATLDACALFLRCRGDEAAVTEISGETQRLILDAAAAACPEALRPRRAAGSGSATPGQVITDKELKILRKWLTKSFAVNHTDRQAVKRLQRRLLLLGYLQEEQVTMVYDAATAQAVTAFQTASGIAPDGIPTKKTLMALFGLSNMQLTGE